MFKACKPSQLLDYSMFRHCHSKILTMWLFVLYFPQFSNPSTIVLLTILTVVMGSYFFFNRQMGGEGATNMQQIYHNH
uniref:Uncharacterized protein n=1 Tax=Ditylenchus dipsaci TaxID=166011 RepID=A0A915EEN4_9BILA